MRYEFRPTFDIPKTSQQMVTVMLQRNFGAVNGFKS